MKTVVKYISLKAEDIFQKVLLNLDLKDHKIN